MRRTRLDDWTEGHPVGAGLLSGLVIFVGAVLLEFFVFHWQHETIGVVVFLSVANGLAQYGGAKRRRCRNLEHERPMPDLVESSVNPKERRPGG